MERGVETFSLALIQTNVPSVQYQLESVTGSSLGSVPHTPSLYLSIGSHGQVRVRDIVRLEGIQ